jgi:hypothetical protein
MQGSMMLLSVGAFLLLGFALVGGPMLLVDWSRKRWQMAIERQIALTDALDGKLGAIVAPVVTRPFFGPWEIRIAVPLLRSAALARILSVVDSVFCDRSGRSYRIVLSAKQGSRGGARVGRVRPSAKPWARKPIPAA